jgi:flagellar hook-associated protein 2
MAVSSTGSITSSGIGSGLDVETIITKLMAIEQRPLTLLQTSATDIQTKISAFGSLTNAESSFRDAALAISKAETWTATNGVSSDTTSVGVSSSATATAGTYSVSVQKLAAAQSVAGTAFASSGAAVGSGTLHIDTGSWNAGQTAFTAKSGSTGVDITVTASDTLASVRDKINAAGTGVNASIVTDATGARLVLTSSATGTANGFRVTAVDDDLANADAAGLSALAFDPPGGTTATTQTQASSDAAATINGLAVTSSSNTLADVVQGLTLNLVKVTTAPVQVSVAKDTASIKTAVQTFAATYNNLASLLAKDIKYDADTKTAGVLQGDSTAVALQRQLRMMMTANSSASTVFSTLSQVGLEMQQDGTLKVNDTKLTSALSSNATEVQKLFSNNDVAGNGAQDGIATKFRKFGDMVLGTDGMLTTRSAGLTKSLDLNSKQQDTMSTRLADTETRLRAQYTALDTKMASLNSLSTYITQQIAQWNKSTSYD